MAGKRSVANPNKVKDFKKSRQKVGKPKKAAKNATRVEYRAKAIVMSKQNLREEHGQEVSSRRKLSLADCLSQLGHPSKLVRRDAAVELSDLLEHHPDVAARATHLPLLVDRLFACVSDEDRQVRHTVRGILRNHLLGVNTNNGRGGSVAKIGPFVPRIMAHVTAALTSLHEDVRLDALGVLDVLGTPGVLPSGSLGPRYAGRVFAHFLDLLDDAGSAAGESSGARRGSNRLGDRVEVRTKVLRSLMAFLVAIYDSYSSARGDTQELDAAADPVPSTSAAADSAQGVTAAPSEGAEESWDGSFTFREGVRTDFVALRFGKDGRLRPRRERRESIEQVLKAAVSQREGMFGGEQVQGEARESTYLERLAASDRKSMAATSARVVSDRERAAAGRRRLVESLSEGDDVDAKHMTCLVTALWPVVVRCWADCEPTTRIASAAEESSLACLLATVDVLLWLVRRLVHFLALGSGGKQHAATDNHQGGSEKTNTINDTLSIFLQVVGGHGSARRAVAKVRAIVLDDVDVHLSAHLPIAVPEGSSPARISELATLNAKLTEIIAHVILPDDLMEQHGSGDDVMIGDGGSAGVPWPDRCLSALHQGLCGFASVKARKVEGRGGDTENRGPEAVTQHSACGTSLLRSLTCVMPSVAGNPKMFDWVLAAFDTFMQASPSGSVTRHACVDLASAVVSNRSLGARLGPERCGAWATLFLRLVWELKGKSQPVAEACLRASIVILDSLASDADVVESHEAAMRAIQAASRPLFAMQLDGKKPRTVFGPFRGLGIGGQILALRFLHALPSLDAKLLKGLNLCLAPGPGGVPPSVASRAVEVVERCHAEGRCADIDFATFLASLLDAVAVSEESGAWEECCGTIEVSLRKLGQVMEQRGGAPGDGEGDGDGDGDGDGEDLSVEHPSLLDLMVPYAESGLSTCTSDEDSSPRSTLAALRLVCACLGVPWRLVPTRRDLDAKQGAVSALGLAFSVLSERVGPEVPPALAPDRRLGSLLTKALAAQLLRREVVACRFSAYDEAAGDERRTRSPEHSVPFALLALFMPSLLVPVFSALGSFARGQGDLAVPTTEAASRAALSAGAAARIVNQMGTDGGPIHRMLLAHADAARAALDGLCAACGDGAGDAAARASLASTVDAALGGRAAKRPREGA